MYASGTGHAVKGPHAHVAGNQSDPRTHTDKDGTRKPLPKPQPVLVDRHPEDDSVALPPHTD
jgi:hypothetical protein